MAAEAKKGATTESESSAGVGVWIARARAGSALLGFAIAFVVASRAGMPMVDAAIRGLIGAVIFSVVGWWCGLLVIQALMRSAVHQRTVRAQEGVRRAREMEAEPAAAATSSAGVDAPAAPTVAPEVDA
jgi:formate/nitrite transporter FocA (FNT family)